MISSIVSRVSAGLLACGGIALLFVPDIVLTRLITGYPESGLWLGQLLGASWLAMAALNWLSRSAMLGGIYGRPVVFANTALYFIAAMSLGRAATRSESGSGLWALTAIAAVAALVYGWLLMRGPVEADMREKQGMER
jgi:hypothetical protein